MFIRFLFGDDIFISYSRRDGANYAAALANDLSKRGFSCFLDQWGASAASTLSRPVLKALSRSSVLVLIGTQGAANSPMVRQEVERFSRKSWLRSHRPILPINFKGVLNEVSWAELTGLHRIPETEEDRADGTLSASIIRIIENSYGYTRRNQRARWLSLGTALLLLSSVAASIYAGHQRRSALRAQANAEAATNEAKRQEQIARDNQTRAESATTEARRQALIAGANADEAARQEAVAKQEARNAEENAERAREQQQIAEDRRRIAQSQELASSAKVQLTADPELSVLLATEAMRTAYTSQAEDALRSRCLRRFCAPLCADTMTLSGTQSSAPTTSWFSP